MLLSEDHNIITLQEGDSVQLSLLTYPIPVIVIEIFNEGNSFSCSEGTIPITFIRQVIRNNTVIPVRYLPAKPSKIQNTIKNVVDQLEEKRELRDGVTGIPSGFSDLDRITSGFHSGDLIVIGGRPGMGKTSLSLSITRNAAVEYNIPVGYIALEATSTTMTQRMISAEAELEIEKIKKGNLAAYEWEQLYVRIRRLESAPIFFDDNYRVEDIDVLIDKCRFLKFKHEVQLIIIDYVQLMIISRKDEWDTPSSREQEISIVTRQLKHLAKELNIPIIIVSQLSRAIESRQRYNRVAEPQLSDLRDSGSLENDADVVLLLHRPEYYGIRNDENGNSTAGLAEVIVAKQRIGAPDTVNLQFIGKYTKFLNQEDISFKNFGSSNNGIPAEFDEPGTIRLSGRANTLPPPPSSDDDLPPF